jgi:iron complex transport system permease protein
MRAKLGWVILFIVLLGLIVTAFLVGEPWGIPSSSHVRIIRITRILLTVFAGGVLAVVGASLQGLLQNPLVDPYIIGTSSGAGVGVALAILLGWTATIGRPIFGFAGAMGALFLVYTMSRIRGRFSRLSLILAGVAVGFVGSGLITVLIAFADNVGFRELIYLLMGNTGGKWITGNTLWMYVVAGGLSIAGCAWLVARWRSLDVISTNIEAAESLGVDTQKLTTEVFIISALLVGIIVSFVGAISFVGLIVPHIVRFVFGPRHLRVLPASFLTGAVLLLVSDIGLNILDLTCNIALPLSVVTTLVGVPVFIYLMRRRAA